MTPNCAVILAGGKGSRLGCVDKGLLTYQGETFVERITAELTDFEQIFISTNDPQKYSSYQTIADIHQDIGAIGGLHSGLVTSTSKWTFFISVDHPLFVKVIAQYLSEFISSDYDVVIAKDHLGNIYPLCGYYNQRILNTITKQIENNQLSIKKMLALLSVKIVDLSQTVFYTPKLMININTFEDLSQLPLVVAISGRQNTGKTSLICKMIPELTKLGKTVATVKHTKHSYPFDQEGKDTYLHRKYGASASAIFSPTAFMINQDIPKPDFLKLFSQFDVILLEGFKSSEYPKIEVIREGISNPPMRNIIAKVGGNGDSAVSSFTNLQIKDLVHFLFQWT